MRTKIGFLGLVVAGFVIGSVVATNAVLADSTTPTTPTTPVTPVKHHHHHHHIHGKITAVAKDGDTVSSITITIHHHHKKGSTTTTPTTEETTKTINVDSSTKVEKTDKATGTKTSLALTDLRVGEHVSVIEKKDVASEITIRHHRHHKKKPVPA